MSREDVFELVRDAVEQLRLARSPVAACVVRLPRDPPGEAVEVRPASLERDAFLGSARGGEHVPYWSAHETPMGDDRAHAAHAERWRLAPCTAVLRTRAATTLPFPFAAARFLRACQRS